MALYAITWQLNGLRSESQQAADEARIIESFGKFDTLNDPELKHLWFVSTSWSETRLEHYLQKYFVGADRYFITFLEEGINTHWYGHNLSKESGEWLRVHITSKQYLRR